MTIHHTYVGCDIAKAVIDVFDPLSRRFSRVANEAAALARFAAGLAPNSFVVLEATGTMTGPCARRWPRPASPASGSIR